MLIVVLVIPSIREHAVADLQKDWDQWGPLSAIGNLFATFILMAIYGAIGGIFVMGIAGFVRGSETKSLESNDKTSKL